MIADIGLDSHSLGKLGITCRSALSTVYTYVFKHCDTWQLFYCFTKGKLGITVDLSTVYTYVFQYCDTWQLFYCFTKGKLSITV